ncbi:hypothetical protein MC378_03650 [Polaribacter sp. MSW13]|uniref:Tetratricopeptide repeat protein n=1 Tax=Polaribacter marinus TaxID=2916838 RepID=A0A9X1VKN4_9FLAO|nr:hypothetical protein [Polaribacter marinus]MCI2228249.1 hypothetical protein [Polaribacter marinus]
MITILTTTNFENQIQQVVSSIDRLNELVIVVTETDTVNFDDKKIIVKNNLIQTQLDWNDTEPPYIFPNIPFSSEDLLALIFYKLGNHQKAFQFISEKNKIYHHLLIATHLQFGYTITNEQINFLKKTSLHNLAIAYNFGDLETKVDKTTLQNIFEEALKNAQTNSLKLFSTKHYVNLLLDNGLYKDAEKLINSVKSKANSNEEKNALNHLLVNALMPQITVPYDIENLKSILNLQLNSISYYQSINLTVNAGLLLIDASEIASYLKDYIQAKDLINKAILYFKEAEIPEFLGEATLQKAILLYTWSKNGNPQYYKPAINTFQNALKVFKRDTHPQKFANIHHNLALIYSEIQVSEKEKAIWTAFCASSFKEALEFYNKEQFPYENAMISHNYATALMGFPEAKLHNNLKKAFDLFEQALNIRTSKEYPFERALTLLNQLELYWLIHNETEKDEVKNYEIMLQKANEVIKLVTDNELIEKANNHKKELKKLNIFID